MTMLALARRQRGRMVVPDVAPVLPPHVFDPSRGLNVRPDGSVLVDTVPMAGFSITQNPPPIGAKKDDE